MTVDPVPEALPQPPSRRRAHVLQPLHHRSFALLWLGQTVSRLGDGAYGAVLAWTVYAIGGSAAGAGYVLAAFSLPQVLFLLAGGVVGDRLSRRAVVLVANALSAAAVGAVTVLAALGRLQVAELAALSAIFGAVSAFFLPAYQALLPDVVPEEQLQAANALEGISASASQVIGPSIGALAYAAGRAAGAFGFDAASFLVAAMATVFVRAPQRSSGACRSIRADLKAGWGYVWSTTWLWVSIALATVANAVGGAPRSVLLPVIIKQLHLGVQYVGLTLTIAGIAAVGANLIVGHLPPDRRRGVVLYALWCLFGLSTILVGVASSYWVVVIAAVVLGIGAASDAIWQSLVQQLVPKEYLSRVFSLDLLGAFAMMPLGYALSGILASYLGPRPVLIGGGALLVGITAVGLLVPSIRRL